jgi:signal recognition particle GTPase
LQIDDALMNELGHVKDRTSPDEIFLVVDSMVGQDAVNSAKVFNGPRTTETPAFCMISIPGYSTAPLSVRKLGDGGIQRAPVLSKK